MTIDVSITMEVDTEATDEQLKEAVAVYLESQEIEVGANNRATVTCVEW